MLQVQNNRHLHQTDLQKDRSNRQKFVKGGVQVIALYSRLNGRSPWRGLVQAFALTRGC